MSHPSPRKPDSTGASEYTPPEATKPLSELVSEKISEKEDIPPTELDPQLHEAINPEALDQLFAPTPQGAPRSDGKLIFNYYGYEIYVESSGDVSIRG